jgi:sugar phosphate isomerase/epimerase
MNYSRRHFLRTTSCLAVALSAANVGLRSLAADKAKPWMIACRDEHLRASGKDDCWSAMKALGVDGTEVAVNLDLACPGLYHPEKKYHLATSASVRMLQEDLKANDLAITSFFMANQLDRRLEQELVWAKSVVKAAQVLGVRSIRIDVVPHVIPRAEFLSFAIKACRQLCDLVDDTPIRWGVENHGNTTNDPEFLAQLFDGVNSAHLGLTLDTGNFYWFGHPLSQVYKLYEQFAPRVVHTHIKSIRFPEDKKEAKRPMGWEYGKYNCPIYEGDVDFTKVISILRRANYQGDLCIEDESLGKFPADERAEVLRKEVGLLKSLV